jgi:hypothetical protein
LKPAFERRHSGLNFRIVRVKTHQYADPPHLGRLLRARR